MIRRALLLWLAGAAGAAQAAEPPVLLPAPARMEAAQGGFALGSATRVVAADPGARAAAVRMRALLASSSLGGGTGTVRFVRAPGLPAEGYRLTAGPAGAVVTASDDAGLFYGAVTLWQLATQPGRAGAVAGVRIEDAPRFRWRGLMLDSARHFQSPAFVRRLIDGMAAGKMNRLHWHLVDDQGWRIAVPGWPKLTAVSAWRRPATAPGAPPLPAVGGVYTRADIRGIVAYAAERHVQVVPEIEMPGHATAAIRAYPELGTGVPLPPGVWSDWGVFPWLYAPGERTFAFLRDVLTEVMALFPGRDIHIGGDEAVKDQWRASPAVQARIRELGLKDEEALQGWFMARVARFLAAHGRRAVGWDEILDGGVPRDVAITSWRGTEGAVKAARAGHDAILSPAPVLYLNNRQGTGPAEPPSHGALETLADVLAFDPVPAELSAGERRHLLGLQANLWTEHVRTEDRAAWMLWPRTAAVAEIGWAPAPGTPRTIAGFAPALVAQLDRLRPMGLAAANSAWAVAVELLPEGAGVRAALSGQSGLPIRYTLDGGVPTAASPAYAGPLTLAAGTRLRAASFLEARALPGGFDARLTQAAAPTRTSRQLTLCSAKVPLDLEDDWPAAGPRAHFFIDILDPCWRWPAAPAAGVRRIAVSVGQLPFNFQVGRDREGVRFRPPATPAGEVEVRDGCGGALLASLPLAPAAANPGVTRLVGPLKRGGRDLCFTYTARGVDPLWAIDRVELLP